MNSSAAADVTPFALSFHSKALAKCQAIDAMKEFLHLLRILKCHPTRIGGSEGWLCGHDRLKIYDIRQNSRVNFLPPDLAQFEPKNADDCSCKCK